MAQNHIATSKTGTLNHMAPLCSHFVTLGGPQDQLENLFQAAQAKRDDMHLAPIGAPTSLPPLTHHQIMAWNHNKTDMMVQMRQDIKREVPFAIMEWEVHLWLAGKWPNRLAFISPIYNNGVSTLSIQRLFRILRLNRDFTAFGPLGQPTAFNAQNSALEIFTFIDQSFAKAVFVPDGPRSVLHLHFDPTRNTLPPSVFALEDLKDDERQNIFVISHVFEDEGGEHSGSLAFPKDGFQRLPSQNQSSELMNIIDSFDFPRFVTKAHIAALQSDHPLQTCKVQTS